MAKIALRVYNNEISELIDSGLINEATAHCLHILELFPRHVDTYRLLGKAYLEGKQYRDAADIFQRVLSSIPDDFIANVGMSIIREAEGDLPAAVYHMERTFERQPSNQAIQEELRRLYGKRDGIEPAKTRLTRAALARMYAHGNLHDQAAAELVAALSEEPQRLDLQVLLADLYYRLNKHEEAIEICTHILNILPNSIDANRILYQVLKDTAKSSEAAEYHKRWAAMEPYAAFASDDQASLESIPDSMVTLSRLEIGSGQSDYGEPDTETWNAADHVPERDEKLASEEIPDWLRQSDEVEPGFDDEEDTPDWLADLGGMESEIPEEESPTPIQDASSEQKQDAVDTPSWLNDSLLEDAGPSETDELSSPIEEDEPTAGDFDPSIEGTQLPAEFDLEEESLDEVLATAASPPAEGGRVQDRQEDDDVPDWMQELTDQQNSYIEEQIEASEDSIAPAADAPDWLQELKPDDMSEDPSISHPEDKTSEEDPLFGDSLDWLDEPVKRSDQEEDDVPDWMQQLTAGEETGEETTEGIAPEQVQQSAADEGPGDDDVPDWMQQLTAGEETTEDMAPEQVQQSSADEGPGDEDVPDWMQQLTAEGETVEDMAPEQVQQSAVDEGPEDEDVPDWMQQLTAEEETGAQDTPEWVEQSAGDEEQAAETPDWIKDSAQESTETSLAPEETAPGEESAGKAKDIDELTKDLDWLDELGEPQHTPESGESSQDTWQSLFQVDEDEDSSPPPQPMKTASIADEEDDEDSLSWLNDLPSTSSLSGAAKPVEDERPEETSPDTTDIGGDETLATETEPEAQPSEILGADELDWFDEVLVGDDLDAPPETSAEEKGSPDSDEEAEKDWMSSLTEEEDIGGEEAGITEDKGTARAEDEASPIEGTVEGEEFEWIESPAPKPTEENEKQAVTQEDDWLQSLLDDEDEIPAGPDDAGEEEEEEDIPSKPSPEPDSDYAVLEEQSAEEWLDAFKQETDTEANPDLDEEPLDWVDDLIIEEKPKVLEVEEEEEEEKQEEVGIDIEEEIKLEEPARVKPPSKSLEMKSVLNEIEQREDDPDWLKSVDTGNLSDKPDWLQNLNHPQETVVEPVKPVSDDVDEWLKYLSEPVSETNAESFEAELDTDTLEERFEEDEEDEIEETLDEPLPSEAEEDIQVEEEMAAKDDLPTIPSTKDLDETINKYSYLIRKGRDLERIVETLQDALKQHPMDARLWQILGDAYLRLDQLQEALDAYTQAENLLR